MWNNVKKCEKLFAEAMDVTRNNENSFCSMPYRTANDGPSAVTPQSSETWLLQNRASLLIVLRSLQNRVSILEA
jgi:hypothetical protein